MIWSIVQGPWTFYTLLGVMVSIAAAVVAVTVHGSAHARMARALGDRTAENYGKIALNPREHYDPIGSTALALFGWGWEKLVPFYPGRGRNGRRDMILFALAGPFSNIVLAIVLGLALRFLPLTSDILAGVFAVFVYINLWLAFFNFLPFPPLDGLKVILEVLPPHVAGRYERFMDRWGFLILLGLVFILRGALVPVIDRPLFSLASLVTGLPAGDFAGLLGILS